MMEPSAPITLNLEEITKMENLEDSPKPKPFRRKIRILKNLKKNKNKLSVRKLHKHSSKGSDGKLGAITIDAVTTLNCIGDKQSVNCSKDISDNNFKNDSGNMDVSVDNDKCTLLESEVNLIDKLAGPLKEKLPNTNKDKVEQSQFLKMASDKKKVDQPINENTNQQQKVNELPTLTLKIVQKKVFNYKGTNKTKPLYEIVQFTPNKVFQNTSNSEESSYTPESNSTPKISSKSKLKHFPLKKNIDDTEICSENKKRTFKNEYFTPILNKLKDSLESLKRKNKPFLDTDTMMNDYSTTATKRVTNTLLHKLCSDNSTTSEDVVSYDKIKIINVVGGYRSPSPKDDVDNFQIGKTTKKKDNVIVPTKTTDITKIKGWRNKKFSKNDQIQNSHETTTKSDTISNSVFSSNILDDYLTENSNLNVSYDVPTLEAEETIEETHAVFNFPKTTEFVKVKPPKPIVKNEDVYKPRTLAEKRLLLQSGKSKIVHKKRLGRNKKKSYVQSEYMRKKYANKYNRYTKKNLTSEKPFKEPRKIGRKKLVKIEKKILKTDRTPEIIDDDIKKFEKPSLLNYMKCDFKQLKYDPIEWESVEVKLPKIQLEIIPQINKRLRKNIKHLIENDNTILTEDRVAFALSMLKTKSTVPKPQKFIFPIPYEDDQTTMILKRKIAKFQNVSKSQLTEAESEEDITKGVNEVISKMLDYVEIAEETKNIIQKEDDSRTEAALPPNDASKLIKKRKRQLEGESKSLRKTTLEMKRLSCKIVSVGDEESECTDNEPCEMEFCKLGCICKTLECNIVSKTHCGELDCIFGCTCGNVTSESHIHENVLNRLGNEAKKDLAKVEKEFTQTVIKTKDQLIMVNSNSRKRRATKFPKKYDDFIEEVDENIKAAKIAKIAPPANSTIAHDHIVTKPCYVKLLQYNFQHIVPFCMDHYIHNCPCKDKFSVEYLDDDRRSPSLSPPDNSNNIKEEYTTARTNPLDSYYHTRNKTVKHEARIKYYTQVLQDKLEIYLRGQPNASNNKRASPTDSNSQSSIDVVLQSQDNEQFSTISNQYNQKSMSFEGKLTNTVNNVSSETGKQNSSSTFPIITKILQQSSEENNNRNVDLIKPNLIHKKPSSINFINILGQILQKDNNDSEDSFIDLNCKNDENTSKTISPLSKSLCPETIEKKLQRRKQKLINKNSNEMNPIKNVLQTPQKNTNEKEKSQAEFMLSLVKSNHHLRLLPWSKLSAQYEQGSCQLWFSSYNVPLIFTENGKRPYDGFLNVKKSKRKFHKVQSAPTDIMYHLTNKKVPFNLNGDNILLILVLKTANWQICGMCKKENPNNDRALSLIEVFGGSEDFSKVNNTNKQFSKRMKTKKVNADREKKIHRKTNKSLSLLKPKNTNNRIPPAHTIPPVKLNKRIDLKKLPNKTTTRIFESSKLEGTVGIESPSNMKARDASRSSKLQEPIEMKESSKGNVPKLIGNLSNVTNASTPQSLNLEKTTDVGPLKARATKRVHKEIEIEGLLDVKVKTVSGSSTILQTITGHKGALYTSENAGGEAMNDRNKITTLNLEKFTSIKLISEENSENNDYVRESMWACLPSITLACKWRVISTEKPFEYMTLTRNSFSIKYKDIQRLLKVAQVHGKALVLKSRLLQKHYFHRNFGVYCVGSHSSKIFIGPYFLSEEPDIDVLTYIDNTLVNTALFSQIGNNKNLPGSGKWFHQVTNTEDDNDCDDVILIRENASVIDLTNDNDEATMSSNRKNSLFYKKTIENINDNAISNQAKLHDNDDVTLIETEITSKSSEENSKKIESTKFIITNVPTLGYMVMNIYNEKVGVICPVTQRPKEFDNTDKALEAVKGLFAHCFYKAQDFHLQVDLVDEVDKSVYKPFDRSTLIGIHVVGTFGVRNMLNITPDELMELGLNDDHIANIVNYPQYKTFINNLQYLGNLLNKNVNINTLKSSTETVIEEAISEIKKLEQINEHFLKIKAKHKSDGVNLIDKVSKITHTQIKNFNKDDILIQLKFINSILQSLASRDTVTQLKDSINTVVTSQNTFKKLKVMQSLLKSSNLPKQCTVFEKNTIIPKTFSNKFVQKTVQPSNSIKYVIMKNNQNSVNSILKSNTVQNRSKVIQKKSSVLDQSAIIVPVPTTKIPVLTTSIPVCTTKVPISTANFRNLKFSPVPILTSLDFQHVKLPNVNKPSETQQKPEPSSSSSQLQVIKTNSNVNSENIFVINSHDSNGYYHRLTNLETPVFKRIRRTFKIVNGKLI